MIYAWDEALHAYRYPVDLPGFDDAHQYPGWFTLKLTTGDPQETTAFETHFRNAAERALEPWFEVVFWKLYSMPLARQQQTKRFVQSIQTRHVTPKELWASCNAYVDRPSLRTFNAFKETLGVEGTGIAVAATFPAFMAPDRFPMVDRRIAKWVEYSHEEHNRVLPETLKLVLPVHSAMNGELLTTEDFDFVMSWTNWCRYMAGRLSKSLGYTWRARDVEMAVFQAWGRGSKGKSKPDLTLEPVSPAEATTNRAANDWGFRFSLPNVPKGQPITADEAEKKLLEKVSKLEQDWLDATWDLARFYSLTGRQEEALKQLERYIVNTADLEARAGCFLAMGQLMEQVQAFDAAIMFYSRAFALEPTGTKTWYLINNNLGYCLNHFGRFKEAENYCRAAIKIDPERYNAHKNLGVSLEGQGEIASAARCYIQAVKAEASDPRAWKLLDNLVAKNPELPLEIPDILQQLESCRAAVEYASNLARRYGNGAP